MLNYERDGSGFIHREDIYMGESQDEFEEEWFSDVNEDNNDTF